MPAIAGILQGQPGSDPAALAGAMIQCMMHRPAYRSGMQSAPELASAVGWASLPSLASGPIPVWNKTRDVCLVLSGEVFPERSLPTAAESGSAGPVHSLVETYRRDGARSLEQLNGSFCGVLMDLEQGRVVLFNDRYGLHRIFIHESDGSVYFSSEAKSLLKVLPSLRRLNPQALGEWLTCGCVLQHRTLFEGVSILPPGSMWTSVQGRGITKQAYFDPLTWEEQPPLDEENLHAQLRAVWEQVVRRHLHGADNVGLSLTGGVDSRMILAWAREAAGRLPSYTFGGEFRDSADVRISRTLADLCGQAHEVIRVGRGFVSQFPALAEEAVYVSDGSMDVTGSIDVFVQRRAREIAPIRVTGTNGGEILRRLVVFKPGDPGTDWLQPEMLLQTRQASATYAEARRGHPLTFTAFKQTPWFMAPKFGLERLDMTLRLPYVDNEFVKLAYRVPERLAHSHELSLRLIGDGNKAVLDVATDRGSSPRMLVIAGFKRALEHLALRAEYAYDYGMPHGLARVDRALAALHLERLFLGWHKFAHFRLWYRHELSGFVKETLLDGRSLSRPYLQRRVVERLVMAHTKGTANHTRALHKLLTLEIVQRRLIEQN